VTSNDLPGFADAFKSLQRIFPLRGEEGELDRLRADYFRSMRGYALVDVKSGADRWMSTGTKFPRPAEWVAAIPPRTGSGEFRQMVDSEAREYRRAESLGYEDQPCLCSECVRAGVDDRPLRFVPEEDDQGRDFKAFDPIAKRVVTTGHWAHGPELARWYTARDAFTAATRLLTAGPLKTVARAVTKVAVIDREPGEDG
jgi:hypothetical protein